MADVAERQVVLSKIKNPKARREFLKRQPKVIEDDKNVMFIYHNKCQNAGKFMKVMEKLKPQRNSMMFKDHANLFDDYNIHRQMFKKHDISLFVVGSHSKKRPNNLITGRLFNYDVLDMYEFEIKNVIDFENFFKNGRFNYKPILNFFGFLHDDTEKKIGYLKNFLTDLFRGPSAKHVDPSNFTFSISFELKKTENDSDIEIEIKMWNIDIKNRGVVQANEIGSPILLKLLRTKLPDENDWKKSNKRPEEIMGQKKSSQSKKNIETDVFGTVYGRLHMNTAEKNNGQEDHDAMVQTLLTNKKFRKNRKRTASQMMNEAE